MAGDLIEPNPKPVKVKGLVTGLSDMIHRTLGGTVTVETVLAAGLWQVEADPNELEAATSTSPPTPAHIDEAYAAALPEATPGQYVLAWVSDTGVQRHAVMAVGMMEEPLLVPGVLQIPLVNASRLRSAAGRD